MPRCHDELDVVLRALADPNRRARHRAAGEVSRRRDRTPGTVLDSVASLLQQLHVPEDAGLVASEKLGRVRTVSLGPGALDVVHLWLAEQRTPAEHRAGRLGVHLTR